MQLHMAEGLAENKFQDQGPCSRFRILSDSVFLIKKIN